MDILSWIGLHNNPKSPGAKSLREIPELHGARRLPVKRGLLFATLGLGLVTGASNLFGQSPQALPTSCPPANSTAGKDVGHDYFVQVVGHLKDVPVSTFAEASLEDWKPYENTSASWNPLATTWKMDVVCNFNSVGVQNYQNQDMGVQATANTLNLGYYDAIRKMLRAEAFDREGLRAALGTWGTCSGQGCDSLLNKWQDGYGKN